MGVAVQLAVLVSLTEALGLNYLVATVLAVESAILHNFVWHERWTWRDRDRRSHGRWERLAWFNLVTGALSISTNVVFTALYVSTFGIHYAVANVLAIASCSLLTFIANDRFVFRAGTGEGDMMTDAGLSKSRERRPAWRNAMLRGGLAMILAAAGTTGLAAAELHDETIAAWQRYVEATEQRIARELDAGSRFLVQDFRDDPAGARRDVLAGSVRIDKLEMRDADGDRIQVPKGAIHHWRGSVLIAELADAGSPAEREKPIGQDRGFMWRLHSYWRYQQTDAGVIVECESVSLSRSIPRAVRWMATPIVNRTARQVMTRTLTSMAATMGARTPSETQPLPLLASRH